VIGLVAADIYAGHRGAQKWTKGLGCWFPMSGRVCCASQYSPATIPRARNVPWLKGTWFEIKAQSFDLLCSIKAKPGITTIHFCLDFKGKEKIARKCKFSGDPMRLAIL
jgi:hypothetical protein